MEKMRIRSGIPGANSVGEGRSRGNPLPAAHNLGAPDITIDSDRFGVLEGRWLVLLHASTNVVRGAGRDNGRA
jgi:hypothetical protein